MKTIIISALILLSSVFVFGQHKYIGAFAGASYYNGEYNKYAVLNRPSIALGVMYVHDLGPKLSIRFQADKATIRSSNYSTGIFDLGAMFETSLYPFAFDKYGYQNFTPYFKYGASVLLVNQAQKGVTFSIPVGVGVKYAASRNLVVGAEWTYHFTGTEELDADNPDNQATFSSDPFVLLTNDFYSYIGVFARFSLLRTTSNCPAYK